MDYTYEMAMQWIKNNTIEQHGITVTSAEKIIYPEVTGYYIPTLLQWGEKDMAYSYARYLCSIQKQDGSWYDPHNIEPYIFDSCQILKGLVAIINISEGGIREFFKGHLRKGSDWVLSQMDEEGRLPPCRADTFDCNDGYSELIHIYCLSPLVDASEILKNDKYRKAAVKCLDYYLIHELDKILDFHLLAHFYSYVMEGLVDMKRQDIAKKAMDKIAVLQREDGFIPAYKNVKWTCSTALFQFAITWYKMGETEMARRTYKYGCSLQNKTGGWYGKYPEEVKTVLMDRVIRHLPIKPFMKNYHLGYFPNEEISWANKFYLDAKWWDDRS